MKLGFYAGNDEIILIKKNKNLILIDNCGKYDWRFGCAAALTF